jgi:hypothetical protein
VRVEGMGPWLVGAAPGGGTRVHNVVRFGSIGLV